MSLLFKNLKRRLQGKEPVVNTTGVTREEIEEEEDTAPKAIDLDARPPAPPTTDEIADDLIQNAMAQHSSNSVSGQQGQPHRSNSNPSGPVKSRTSYDETALKRLAGELDTKGRGCTKEILRQLQDREKDLTSDVMRSIGHEKVAMSDVVIVSPKNDAPPMVLKNRLDSKHGFEIGMAGAVVDRISKEHAPVDIEIARDPLRTIYLINLDPNREKEWADMKSQQASRVEVEKYILIKGIPNCAVGRQQAERYPKPVITIIRGHAHNSPVGSGEILAQLWTDEENAILSIKIRKGDLPLPLTVEVNADHEGIMGGDLTFLRQGTFPKNDKISRVVVDLNQKGSAGKQPAIDEEFVDQVNKAMDDWDGMEEVDLNEFVSVGASTGGVITSAIGATAVFASSITSYNSADEIPNSRSQLGDQKIQPHAPTSASVIKSYVSERALEISEAVSVQALAKSQKKIEALERKVKSLETKATRASNKKHKAKSSYVSRARGGTTGV